MTHSPSIPSDSAPRITVVGVGPGAWSDVTVGVAEILETAPKVYFREGGGEIYKRLVEVGRSPADLSVFYHLPGLTYADAYARMVDRILRGAEQYGHVVYAIPGGLYVFEKTVEILRHAASERGIALNVKTGMSFLELVFAELRIDPEEGLCIINASRVCHVPVRLSADVGTLVAQFGAPLELSGAAADTNASSVQGLLEDCYGADHPATLLVPTPDGRTEAIPLTVATCASEAGRLCVNATLYIPPKPAHGGTS